MRYPRPLVLESVASELVEVTVADTEPIQVGAAKGRSPVLVIRCVLALKVGSYL